MAANVVGMAFLPYYNHVMKILETNKELKKTFKGALYGYATVEDYDSMLKVLREMSDEDKARLVAKVQELVGSSTLEALTTFIASQVNRELFAAAVREFASAVKSGG